MYKKKKNRFEDQESEENILNYAFFSLIIIEDFQLSQENQGE